MRKKSRKSIVKQADQAFSEAVRHETRRKYGANCPFCRKRRIKCCFHFVTRAKYSVRWDLENAIGSCLGCNKLNEYDPHPFSLWYIENRGLDAFKSLLRRAKERRKFSDHDLINIAFRYALMVAFPRDEVPECPA